MRRVSLTLLSLVAMACSRAPSTPAAGAPPPPEVIQTGGAPLRVERERIATGGRVAASVDQVWNVVMSVYGDLGIEPTTLISQTHTIGNESLKVRRSLGGTPLSRYLNCGSGTGVGPNADYYNVQMSVMTYLVAAGDGFTDVKSVVEATATPVSLGSNPVVCNSTTALEARIAKRIQERLDAGR
jgi:hypothetical protein